ncbi:Hpt domain-containing protein [Saccharophagus sp. K07]|jgi:HPt (histidine-containing phosphotransfer) domain-containing protein|uniref:Hpt domain-containing protein n=1 Tax=Saccharophagus sp. K07 TaxID=2283636 RepID=UPI00165284B5|nr:Hpt domain-containing protein [Saccharophagus sp. K07]MBC6907110.1 Hpt domain-containing protein [Saccharophagus sp. K07]
MTDARIDAAMMEQLKELLGERFTELVDRFIQDGERRLGLLREALKTQDFVAIHAEAHGLKGSSRNIGANILGGLCSDLEQMGKENKAEGLQTVFAALEQEFAAVCAELRTW